MSNDVSRRAFLQQSALAMGGTALWQPWPGPAAASATVALVVSPDDRVAAAPPVRWAVGALRQALEGRGVAVTMATAVDAAPAESLPVLLAGLETPAVAAIADRAGVRPARDAESLAILPGEREGRPALLASGQDSRGLMYAVLELADRGARGRSSPRAEDQRRHSWSARSTRSGRSAGRLSATWRTSAWFTDREFWPAYFGMLARQRFNRFHLALGFGLRHAARVTDAYLLFPYPFLVSVPGYHVRAPHLPDEERDRTSRCCGTSAARRPRTASTSSSASGRTATPGPTARMPTTPSRTHAREPGGLLPRRARGRAAACPDITGVTLRTHYESGVHEGSYAFWKTISRACRDPAGGWRSNCTPRDSTRG